MRWQGSRSLQRVADALHHQDFSALERFSSRCPPLPPPYPRSMHQIILICLHPQLPITNSLDENRVCMTVQERPSSTWGSCWRCQSASVQGCVLGRPQPWPQSRHTCSPGFHRSQRTKHRCSMPQLHRVRRPARRAENCVLPVATRAATRTPWHRLPAHTGACQLPRSCRVDRFRHGRGGRARGCHGQRDRCPARSQRPALVGDHRPDGCGCAAAAAGPQP